MNVLLDRDAPRRKAELADLKARLGACRSALPITPQTTMSAVVRFPCAKGTLTASILLAPTKPMSLQVLDFAAAP